MTRFLRELPYLFGTPVYGARSKTVDFLIGGEAFLRPEADGLLKIMPKKGAYIAPITEAEIDSIMQARRLVEEWCAQQQAASEEPSRTNWTG